MSLGRRVARRRGGSGAGRRGGFRGYGGGGGRVTLRALAASMGVTLIAEFDASRGCEVSAGVPATNGQTIQFWRDQSGNSRDASQATAGLRPQWFATAGPNGRPAVLFDVQTAARYMTTASFPTPAARTSFVMEDPGASGDKYVYANTGTSQGSVQQTPNHYLYAGAFAATFPAPTGFFLDQAVWNGASSRHRGNDGPDATGDPGATALANVTLGWTSVGNTTHSLDGYISHAAWFDGALTVAQVNTIRAWFNDRYSFPQAKLLMWAGDSITENASIGGASWRKRVQDNATAASVARYHVAGPNENLSVVPFSPDRAFALSGQTCSTMLARMASDKIGAVWCPSGYDAVIPLLLGINDILAGHSNATLAVDFASVLDEWHTRCPNALIPVQKLLPVSGAYAAYAAQVAAWNATTLPGVVATKIAAGHNLVLDSTFADLMATGTTIDGLHPDAAMTNTIGDALWAQTRTWAGI